MSSTSCYEYTYKMNSKFNTSYYTILHTTMFFRTYLSIILLLLLVSYRYVVSLEYLILIFITSKYFST